ncbi:hypothetical protein HK096_011631 [Nowakowskiella sp. JEL0078]|nr:hypothetical protein HK096_011631 [Nowakowskiella sp. JEL0078]
MINAVTKIWNPNDRVRLNVGGIRYETYISTLQRDPESLLGMMFSDRNASIVKPDPISKEYFFDRNGHTFEIVLDYCRTGQLNLLAGISLESVRTEMDFWQIGMPYTPSLTASRRASESPAASIVGNAIDIYEEEDDVYDYKLTKDEEDFCNFITQFATSPMSSEDFALIFKRRGQLEQQEKPMNDLLASNLKRKGLTTNFDTIGPSSRRASISSVSSVDPVYVRTPIFSQPLSPTMQLFLERTLSIFADAKAANISQIKLKIDADGEMSGIPKQLDRVVSQRQYWIALNKHVYRCAGVAPPTTSAMIQGRDARTRLQLQQCSGNLNFHSNRTHSLPPLATSTPAYLRENGIGSIETNLFLAWEAVEELYEFRHELQNRLYGAIDLDATQQFLVKMCFDVIAVRKSYPSSNARVQATTFLTHWEVILNVP